MRALMSRRSSSEEAFDFRVRALNEEHWHVSAALLNAAGLQSGFAAWSNVITVNNNDPVSVVIVEMKGASVGAVRIDEIEFVLVSLEDSDPPVIDVQVTLPLISTVLNTLVHTVQSGNALISGAITGAWKFPLSANIGALVPLSGGSVSLATASTVAAGGAGNWSSNVLTDTTSRLEVTAAGLPGPSLGGNWDKNETGTIGGGIVSPSFGFVSAGIAVNSPVDLTVACIMNTYVSDSTIPPVIFTPLSQAVGSLSPEAPLNVSLLLSLYVSDLLSPSDTPSSIYRVQDLAQQSPSIDSALHYLDWVTDVYVPSQSLRGGVKSPQWRLNLPYPIIIGRDQALVATLTIFAASPVSFIVYSRARITQVGI